LTLRGLPRVRRAFFLAAALLLPAAAGAETIDLAYPEDDGVEESPGHFVFDFLRAAEMVVKESGIAGHWIPLPNRRLIYELQQERPNFCIAGAGITPEREKMGKFTLPFFEDHMIAVLALPSGRAKLDKAHSLAELVALGDTTFLGYIGMNYGAQVSAQVEKLGDRLVTAPRSTAQMLDMLVAGRADFAFAPYEYATNYLTARHDRGQFLVRTYPDMHRDFHTAFLCSKKVPDEVIAKLNEAIRRQQPAIEARFGDQPK
jgi:ABC-type amino acid transport substrate-binding protein